MIANAVFGNRNASRTFDPVHPRDPVLARLFGHGRRTASGINVTEDKALTIPTLLRGVSIIANTMMRMERDVFQISDEGLEIDKGHFSRKFLRRKFNPEMLTSDAIEVMQTWVILRGNAVAWINRDGAGLPTDIIPLMPDRVGIFRLSKTGEVNDVNGTGQLMYWTIADGKTYRILPENVIHIRGFSKNGLWGEDIIELMKETIGGDLATREHGHRFFGGGATNAGFVTIPKGLGPEAEERLISSLSSNLQGLGNAHKYVILEEGQVVTPNTITNNDSQFLESKEFNVSDIANLIRIQAEKVGDRKQKSYNSLESARADHKDDDIVPWICKWQDEFDEKLLATEEYENESHCIKFDDSTLEWVPFKERVAAAKDMHLNNMASKDEARKCVSLPRTRGKDGDSFLRPMNHVPASESSMDPEEMEMMSDGTARISMGKPDATSGSADPKAKKLTSVEALQKAYLAVGVVCTSDEARELVNKETEAGLVIPGPEFKPEPTGQPMDAEDPEENQPTPPADPQPKESESNALAAVLTLNEISRIEKRLHVSAIKKAKSSESDFITWLDALEVKQGAEILHSLTVPMVENLKSQLNTMIDSASSGDDLTPLIDEVFIKVFGDEQAI